MATPSLTAPILKSLTEVESERDNAPECAECGDPLDEDRYQIKICIDCYLEIIREASKAYQKEYGVDDPSEYSAGRGYLKF